MSIHLAYFCEVIGKFLGKKCWYFNHILEETRVLQFDTQADTLLDMFNKIKDSK